MCYTFKDIIRYFSVVASEDPVYIRNGNTHVRYTLNIRKLISAST